MYKKLLPLLAALLMASLVDAQYNLRRDGQFFQSRKMEYSDWLKSNELGRFFSLENMQVYPDKVTISLRAEFEGEKAGDSLRVVWKALRAQYYNETRQELHAAMLAKMSFQMELPLDSTEIVLYASGSPYTIHIYGERTDGMRIVARWDESGDNGMGNGAIHIPVGQLNDVFHSANTRLDEKPGVDLPRVRRTVRAFFRQNYLSKGTDWIWTARIDSTSELYNDFTFVVTHISREVLKSHNFFELHQIDIKVEQGENGLDIFWQFQAKYGGGLIFPPRDDSNDYHDFETSAYKEQFIRYQTTLFKHLEAQLRKL